MAFPNARFGAGSGAIVLDNVACTGTEERLVYCPFDRHTGDCYHTQDAGLRCPNLTRMLHMKYTHTHMCIRVYAWFYTLPCNTVKQFKSQHVSKMQALRNLICKYNIFTTLPFNLPI